MESVREQYCIDTVLVFEPNTKELFVVVGHTPGMLRIDTTRAMESVREMTRSALLFITIYNVTSEDIMMHLCFVIRHEIITRIDTKHHKISTTLFIVHSTVLPVRHFGTIRNNTQRYETPQNKNDNGNTTKEHRESGAQLSGLRTRA